MKTLLLSLLLCTIYCHATDIRGKVIQGAIVYPANFPAYLPAGSCLLATLVDASRQDVPGRILASQLFRNPSRYLDGKYTLQFPYSLRLADTQLEFLYAAISLNVGWCSIDGSTVNGDYANDIRMDSRINPLLVKTSKRFIAGPPLYLTQGKLFFSY